MEAVSWFLRRHEVVFETQRMEPMIRRRSGDDVEDGREEDEDGVGGEGDVEDGNVGREEVEDPGIEELE